MSLRGCILVKDRDVEACNGVRYNKGRGQWANIFVNIYGRKMLGRQLAVHLALKWVAGRAKYMPCHGPSMLLNTITNILSGKLIHKNISITTVNNKVISWLYYHLIAVMWSRNKKYMNLLITNLSCKNGQQRSNSLLGARYVHYSTLKTIQIRSLKFIPKKY